MGGAATPSDSQRGLCCTHNPCQEPELWPVDRQSASSALCVQAPAGEHQGIARARNHTCGELSSVLSTRTRAAPLSVAETTLVGSSRSWRGAIVTPPRARGVVFLLYRS
eukprot:scaffold8551_cov132-Isochrysis_galbana.AAC.10